MPVLKPQTRFLARGTALLSGLLILWWFVLLNPLLYLLRSGAGTIVPISETATGDWTIEVRVEAVVPASPEHPKQVPVHSIDFDLARADAGAFTFGLPVFWAVILAVPGIRRWWRPLILGTLSMALVELVLFLIYVELFAHNTAAQWRPAPDPVAAWFYHFGDYLLVSVVPYVAPFLIAIWIHRDLREQIFGRVGEPGPAPARSKKKRARGQAI